MRAVHVVKVTGIAGAERHLLTLLSGLRARQIDARMIALTEPANPVEDYFQALEAKGIPAQREVIHNDVDISLLWRLRRQFRALKPDIVHTHLWHADFFGIQAARLAGIRTVITSRHNDDAFRHRRAIRTANFALWRAVSAGIAISDAIRRFSIEIEGAPPEKVHTVRYGMELTADQGDAAAARKALRRALDIPFNTLLVGMIGRLTEQKGFVYGLRAFATLETVPDAHLVIAGEGPLRAELEREAARLDAQKRVHFLGWRKDVPGIMAALDIFLMPSLWEGFGLVMLEAMAAQLPIIGSAVSAIPEVVLDGQSGILVPPRDVEGLRAALETLLRDHALRKHLGLIGQDRLETDFSAARMVEETLAIYHKKAGR